MSRQPIKAELFYEISPQLVVTGSPTRLSSTDLWVSSFMVQACISNTGNIYIAFSSTNCTNTKGFVLSPESDYRFSSDIHRTIGRVVNLYDVFFDGSHNGDLIIVHYTK